jgi:hypothetical protein
VLLTAALAAPARAQTGVWPEWLGSYAAALRRHFNVRFTATGADLIVWAFDAHGTRARTWRGSALRLP